jgi:AraC-like DNA-binding protein
MPRLPVGWADGFIIVPYPPHILNKSDMHYYEVVAHPALRPFIRCFWGLRSSAARPELQRVLPDGCCELVIHCGDRFTQHLDGRSVAQPRCLLVGPTMRALSIAPGRRVDAIGIRFEPGGAALVVNTPLSELRDTVSPVEDIGAGFAYDIIDALAPRTDAARINLLEEILLRCVQHVAVDREVTHTQQTVIRRGGLVGLDELASATGLSPRQLQRRFQQQVGLSPKQLARIARLQRALAIASRHPFTYSRIAAEAGYADQAHFTREFTSIAGVPPTRYFTEIHTLHDLFTAGALSGPGTTY